MNACVRGIMKLLCVILTVTPGFSQSIITTVAGSGKQGFGGDYGSALSAQLSSPIGVEVDITGNIYIADTYNNCIRKVNPSGIIMTVAGKRTKGFSGDHGPATQAELAVPSGIALDAQGNIYIADSFNNRIRKVTPEGIITTVAGNGTPGYGGDGGPAILAELNNPFDVEVDAAGNIYIADTANHRVRKVTPAGIITTIAGNGISGFSGDGSAATAAQLNGPFGVAVDVKGNIYIADCYNNRIRKVTLAGIITTVAGKGTLGYGGDGGPATSAELNYPAGVEIDVSGALYIVDTYNSRIRKVAVNGIITTIAGTGELGYGGDGGPATDAKLHGPVNVAVDISGDLYISDTGNHRIRKISAAAGVARFFPQFVVGGGYRTFITFGNKGSDDAYGMLTFRDQSGNFFIVKATISLPNSEEQVITGATFLFSLPAGSVGFLTAEALNPNDQIQAGWAQIVSSAGSVYGVARYQLTHQEVLQYTVGVLASQLMQNATIPIDDDYIEGRLTAYALANPTAQNLLIKVALVDQEGNLVDDSATVYLPAGGQIAKYIYEELNIPTFRFRGSIVLRAQAGGSFSAVALIQNKTQFTAIPVAPGKASHIPD